MLETRTRRLAAETKRLLDRCAMVEASVAASGDEDLLDCADMFASGDKTRLREMAEAELPRCKISL